MIKVLKNFLKVAVGVVVISIFFEKWMDRKEKEQIEENNKEQFNFYNWRLGKIAYRVKGIGSPVVLIHKIGLGQSMDEWKQNVEELSKKHTVYTIDLLGFGASDRPKMTYTAFVYVELITDFIRDVIKEPVIAIGNNISSGFLVMASHREKDLFKKAILIAPTGVQKLSMYPTHRSSVVKRIMENAIVGKIIYKIISSRMFIKKVLKDQFYNSELEYVNELVESQYYFAKNELGRYAIASYLGGYMNADITKALQVSAVEIFIIAGEESIGEYENILQVVKKMNKEIEIFVIEDSKEFPHIEKAQKFNERINKLVG